MSLNTKLLKRSAALAALVCFTATAAHAADLPQELPPDPDIFNWSGFYVGGHVGGAFEGNANIPLPGGNLNADLDGILGGAYLGYNWQVDNFVFGTEGDISFGDVKGNAGPVNSFEPDVLGSVRFRAGYAYKNFLPYLTVGLGIASADQRIPGVGNPSNTHLGVVAGGGVEMAFTSQISGRIEYLYSYYDRERYSYPAFSSNTDFDTHVVRGGISWHFGNFTN